jgi:hypothetical protein
MFWAVGAPVEHWDGRAWHVAATPAVQTGVLYSVAAAAPDNVWTVCARHSLDDTGDRLGRALIEHWDGARWSVRRGCRSRPRRGGRPARSPRRAGDDVWAVGRTNRTGCIEHWDGRRWTFTRVPVLDCNYLGGIATIPAGDAWAVGSERLHWTGTQRKRLRGYFRGYFASVASISRNDVWAVGAGQSPIGYEAKLRVHLGWAPLGGRRPSFQAGARSERAPERG